MKMKGKGLTVAASALVFLTFGFWLAAMVTPGWFVLSEQFNSSMVKDSSMSGKRTDSLVSAKTNRACIKLSIFYCTLCLDGYCVSINYNQLPESAATNLPGWKEIQIESVSAVLLCVIAFFLILLNFRSPIRVKTGCVALVTASLIELFLVGRMGIANSKLKNEVHSVRTELESKDINMEVQFPFSVIVALFGLLPSMFAICFGVALHSKLNQTQRESGGRMLNLVPSQPNNYRILKESY